ncbi:PNOC protein, partial [Mohoua ochrocephala]|nr:PNOC protein [Mohoua ochrocephala]
MRAVLWDLLLLCLFARARGDCRGDCLHCDRQLYRDSFDVLVSATAVPCPLSRGGIWAPFPSLGIQGGFGVTELLRRRGADAEEAAPGTFPQPPQEDISRRLGRFPPGTGGWHPAPVAKGVQKRYGGFIGVRKSARKWNNQKRFSEFLKQYLGMAPRSSEYGLGGGTGEHNEI